MRSATVSRPRSEASQARPRTPAAAARPQRVQSTGLKVAGIGRVYLWSGGSLWIGRSAGATQRHAHHAIQITLSLDGAIRLRGRDDTWIDTRGALVLHDEPHQFDGQGLRCAHLMVAPESAVGRALAVHYRGSPVTPLPAALAERLAQAVFRRYEADKRASAMQAAALDALCALGCSVDAVRLADAHPVDPRIARALTLLPQRLEARPTLAQMAAAVHLSPGRFRHLFVAQTGVSFRAYVLWLRMQAAVRAFDDGQPWTEAAHLAGFADSAHLSRTFRRLFGISPVMLKRE